jgi:hypothetical protein
MGMQRLVEQFHVCAAPFDARGQVCAGPQVDEQPLNDWPLAHSQTGVSYMTWNVSP